MRRYVVAHRDSKNYKAFLKALVKVGAVAVVGVLCVGLGGRGTSWSKPRAAVTSQHHSACPLSQPVARLRHHTRNHPPSQSACVPMPSTEIKDIETSLAGLRAEKHKAEQAEAAVGVPVQALFPCPLSLPCRLPGAGPAVVAHDYWGLRVGCTLAACCGGILWGSKLGVKLEARGTCLSLITHHSMPPTGQEGQEAAERGQDRGHRRPGRLHL